jgi:hypothetical protein
MKKLAYSLGKLQEAFQAVIDEALEVAGLNIEEYNAFWDEFCRGSNGDAPSE